MILYAPYSVHNYNLQAQSPDRILYSHCNIISVLCASLRIIIYQVVRIDQSLLGEGDVMSIINQDLHYYYLENETAVITQGWLFGGFYILDRETDVIIMYHFLFVYFIMIRFKQTITSKWFILYYLSYALRGVPYLYQQSEYQLYHQDQNRE